MPTLPGMSRATAASNTRVPGPSVVSVLLLLVILL